MFTVYTSKVYIVHANAKRAEDIFLLINYSNNMSLIVSEVKIVLAHKWPSQLKLNKTN